MVLEAEFFHKVEAVLHLNFPLVSVSQVSAVANQVAYDIFFGVIFNFLLPAPDILEGGRVGYVVDQDDGVTALVEYAGYVSE